MPRSLFFTMPTFDFINLVRKVVSTAVSAVASPTTAVLAGSALLATFLGEILSLFDLSLPQSLYSYGFNYPEGCEQYAKVFLYAIRFDFLLQLLNWVLGFFSSLVGYVLKFFISLITILVSVGVYRVIRSQLKDLIG